MKILNLLFIGFAFSSTALATTQISKDTCETIYQACLNDTSLPKDQILMGVRGMCHDQQDLCQKFHKQLESCVKDYGLKACKRIYRVKLPTSKSIN